MFRRIFTIYFCFLTLSVLHSRNDEGMWLPLLIEQNFDAMEKLGFKLTPEHIYSVNNSSIKDAVVSFGGFCTGEIISPKGLILTNHHCGYGQIQALSSEKDNYLENGFWAKNHNQELPAEDLHVSFLLSIEDATEEVNAGLNDKMSYDQRESAIDSLKEIISERLLNSLDLKDSEKEFYNVKVKSFLNGNEFYAFVYQKFNDIRLVGTPPNSIGKYGGDTDNWMWPRHTGDFSLFRIYASKDGKPANYNKDNVPYAPKHHFPISLKGVEKNDFAMVMGFPGRTERYKTSHGISSDMTISNPARIALREKRLAIMKEDMRSEVSIDIQYAAKYAQISNYYKYFIGQNKGLKRLNTLEYKRTNEAAFNAWAKIDSNSKFQGSLEKIGKAYDNLNQYQLATTYLMEAGFAPEMVMFGYKMMPLYGALKSGNNSQAVIEPNIESIKESAVGFFKDFNLETDKKIFVALMAMYKNDVSDYHPTFFALVDKKFKGSFERYADKLYSKSIFRNQESLNSFLANPSLKVLEKDMGFNTMMSVLAKYREMYMQTNNAKAEIDDNMRIYIEGLRKKHPNKLFYGDANSTMRVSYGKVIDYDPRDAVHFNYYTNIEGIMEKMDNTDEEFTVPSKLVELYEAKDYGRYGIDGTLRVNFITDNDITGGNSGSPVINGSGELIGCAFDGNWEAMTGDLVYDGALKRCINVDVRYILFVIEKFAGAENIIEEMTINE